VAYDERPLLGFNEDDMQMIEAAIISHLS